MIVLVALVCVVAIVSAQELPPGIVTAIKSQSMIQCMREFRRHVLTPEQKAAALALARQYYEENEQTALLSTQQKESALLAGIEMFLLFGLASGMISMTTLAIGLDDTVKRWWLVVSVLTGTLSIGLIGSAFLTFLEALFPHIVNPQKAVYDVARAHYG